MGSWAAPDRSLPLAQVFVDTVGDPVRYEQKLEGVFKGAVKFTVRKKADSLYKVVSAASICAKVRCGTSGAWAVVSPHCTPHRLGHPLPSR